MLPSPVLIRGAITVGNIFAKGDITFGPGLTEAYLMEEKCAKYPRIIMTKSTLEHGMKNTEELVAKNGFGLVFCDFDEFYSVEYVNRTDSLQPANELWASVFNCVTEKLNSEPDSAIREKYLYLKKRLCARHGVGH